jgi:hypothetical protein
MTEQQLTENQIQAATGHVVTLLARAKNHFRMRIGSCGCLQMKSPDGNTDKGLSSDWQSG